MSLVAYEASSSDDDENASADSCRDCKRPVEGGTSIESITEDDVSRTELNVISNHVVRSYRSRYDGKTKIILADSDISSSSDEDDPQVPKRRKPATSSLLALLPCPQRKEGSDPGGFASAELRGQNPYPEDDLSSSATDDGEEPLDTDFFSLSKLDEPVDAVAPEVSSDLIEHKCDIDFKEETSAVPTLARSETPSALQVVQPLSLDEEARKELSKLKRLGRPIEWSSIEADALTGGSREQLLKNITADDEQLAKVNCQPPSNPLSKRKHQMTYLAYLAKSQEHDLKMQWSQNAANRRESRARYGF